MVLTITIDPARCMGSGSCTFWAANTFDVGDDNVALVLDAAGDDEDRIRTAVDGCPTQAISVTGWSDEGG